MMTAHILGLALDIAVLIGLGFTIFYCLRLSRSMNNFRQHRQDMGVLINDLSKNIDEALRAIDGLKIAGDRSGRDLQKIISESKSVSRELQEINEAGNSLASRLENLAGKSRASSQSFETKKEYSDDPPKVHAPPRNTAAQKPAFYIQDRDHGLNDDDPVNDDDDTENMSQAEKELAAALRKNKKPSGPGFF
jgi:hypothetical protein